MSIKSEKKGAPFPVVIHVVILSIVMTMAAAAPPATAQVELGAREIALGQAATALPGSNWSLFSNPSMADPATGSISFYGVRHYGLSELTDMAVSVSHPVGKGVFSGGAYRYGFELFSENRFRVGYARTSGRFRYGAALNYTHVDQAAGYGSAGALGVDLGIAAGLGEDLWIGAKAANINRPQYGVYGGGIAEAPPGNLSIGLSYRLSGMVLFTTDVVREEGFPASFRAGIEGTLHEQFLARAGLTTSPETLSLGFGYRTGWGSINVAARRHEDPALGLSPGLDFSLLW